MSTDGRWQPYPAYKDSGVEWLGEIPAQWDIARLKHVARLEYGDSLPKDSRKAGDVPVFGSNGAVGSHSRPNTLAPVLIIGRKGSFGKVNFSTQPVFAIDTTYYIDSRNTRAGLRWLFYALQLLRLDAFTQDSAVPGLSREFAYEQWLPLVTPSDQCNIAAFLDRETAKIDALMAKQERLIELLQEKRAALISHAVTKGLDPTVPMKDSGISWLGEIPAHWEVVQTRHIAESLQTGPFGSQLHASDYSTGGVPVINPSHMQNGRIEPDWDVAVDEKTARRLARHRLRAGDIVFARRGDLGRCAVATRGEEGWLCGTGSLRMRPNLDLAHPSYLNQVLSTSGIAEWLLLQSVGSTMDNLNTAILSRLPLPVPPLVEQCAIAAQLNQEAAKLDVLIAKAREMIKRLQEYRTALISAAVTGKIDVRDDQVQRTSEVRCTSCTSCTSGGDGAGQKA